MTRSSDDTPHDDPVGSLNLDAVPPLPADLAARLADLPLEIEPSHDLWSGIEAAITPVRRATAPPPAPTPPAAPGWAWAIAGLAAAAAIAVSSAWITARTLRPDAPAPVAFTAPADRSPDGAGGGEDPGAQWEREMRRTTDDLQQELTARRAEMDPEAVATVERALTEIDAAIAEIRGALRKDPANDALQTALASAWQHKVDVLRSVQDLP